MTIIPTLLLFVTCCSLAVSDALAEQTLDKGELKFTGSAVIKGTLAKKKLLKDLKPIGRSGNIIFYRKSGGRKQMYEDFYSTNPQRVLENKLHEKLLESKTGSVGNLYVYYEIRKNGLKRIVLAKLTRENKDAVSMKDLRVIDYVD